MYTLCFSFEDKQKIEVEVAQRYTKNELRNMYNQETRTYFGMHSKVTLIEVYRFEECIFEYSTINVNACSDIIELLYNQIKNDDEYCMHLYWHMTDWYENGNIYRGD